ncbi:hypothetical protein IEN91_05070 [Bacillus velezensis]|uniref:hypothetical protein n=1 Tax=Bacillus velezensis TaxID=492670 RepID=UPI0018C66F89|nr:hypothetical protein [Bacillus velezensis]QPK89811.1 hypothetical protein IEN91_05070 [Bacillus velezensis]
MHLNIVHGDHIFEGWKDGEYKKFNQKVHELRMQGYRRVGQDCDFMNYYEYYKKKKSKKVITLTIIYP